MPEDEKKEQDDAKRGDTLEAPASKSAPGQDKQSKEEGTEEKTQEPAKETSEPKPDEYEIEAELSNEYKLPSAGQQRRLDHKNTRKLITGALLVVVLAILAAGFIWVAHDNPISSSESEIIF